MNHMRTSRRDVIRRCCFAMVMALLGTLVAAGWSSATAAAKGRSHHSSPARLVTSKARKVGIFTSSITIYPPSEFVEKNGKTYTGWEVQLTNAVFKLLHLKVKYITVSVTANIPGVQDGRWQLSDGTWGVTKPRLKMVNFVTDLRAGTQLYVAKGTKLKIRSKQDVCGLTVAVQKATVEQTRAYAYQKTCSSLGKSPMHIQLYPSEPDVVLAVTGGRAEVAWTTGIPAGYVVKQHPGQFKLIGGNFTFSTIGIVVSKKYPGLARAMAAAINRLIKDGKYAKILRAWGVGKSGIHHSVVRT